MLDFIKRQKGASLSGVKIYESLHEAYPHHPAQSWRNRWVKNLSQRHNLDIEPVPTESSPPRTFGFSREEDGIILSSIRQPDANPEDEEFWESLAATVLPEIKVSDCSISVQDIQLKNGANDTLKGLSLKLSHEPNRLPRNNAQNLRLLLQNL